MKKLLFLLSVVMCPLFSVAPFTQKTIQKVDNSYNLTIEYKLDPDDAFIKNSFRFAFNHPNLQVAWDNEHPETTIYDAQNMAGTLDDTSTGKLKLTITSTTGTFPEEAMLFIHYHLKQHDHPEEWVQKVIFTDSITKPASIEVSTPLENPISQKDMPTPATHHFFDKLGFMAKSFKTTISNLVENTSSMPLQLFFVYLLGILMSLTPCIYPMIPITIGILQTTASSSFARNFLLASSYTLGIATTFAMLGLLAATGSAHFGALLSNPYFVLFLVFFLGYLAFSMLGLYDMYTPRFMRGSDQQTVNGSFLASFLFGAMSGTVASPCVSPGLFLLLSIVATLGNIFLGFLYLFIFGLGLGTPLLLIGTFSNALNISPRPGLWMVEVKKLFGFLLLGMCFYYLSNILTLNILLLMIAGTCFTGGIWFIYTIENYYGRGMRLYKQIVGILLLIAAFLLSYQAIKETMMSQEQILSVHPVMTYEEARQKAIADKKLLLVDFGAQWCTICKEIEHRFFTYDVRNRIQNVIIVQIDCTHPQAVICKSIIDRFKVIGFPTILLLKPTTQEVIARWGSELLDLSLEDFINLIQQHI